MPVRAVLDTQIVVRGILRLRPSAAVAVFDEALAGERLVGVTSSLLLDEVARVLRRGEIRKLARPPLDNALVDRVVSYLARRFEVAPGAFRALDKVPDDAKDHPLVEAALEVEAEAIVSEDQDLLSLKVVIVAGFRPVQVYAPSMYLKRLLAE